MSPRPLPSLSYTSSSLARTSLAWRLTLAFLYLSSLGMLHARYITPPSPATAGALQAPCLPLTMNLTTDCLSLQETSVLPQWTLDLRPLLASIRRVRMSAALRPPRPLRCSADFAGRFERQDAVVRPRTRLDRHPHQSCLHAHGDDRTPGGIRSHTIHGTPSALPGAGDPYASSAVHRALPSRSVDANALEPALGACQPNILPRVEYGRHLGVCRELVRCDCRRGMLLACRV